MKLSNQSLTWKKIYKSGRNYMINQPQKKKKQRNSREEEIVQQKNNN